MNVVNQYIILNGGKGGARYGSDNYLRVYTAEKHVLKNITYEENITPDTCSSIEPSDNNQWIIISRGIGLHIYELDKNGVMTKLVSTVTETGTESEQKHAKMSPIGDYIATGGLDGILRIYKVKYLNNNINSVVPEKEFPMHSAQINAVGFSQKGDIVFSASSDRTCRIFSTRDWKQIRCLSFGLPSLNTKFHPKLNCLVTLATQTRKESYLTFWNVGKDYDPLDSVKVHSNTCYRLTMGGDKLAIGSNDGFVSIFDTRKWAIIRKERVKTTVPITTLAFLENNRNVLAISTCCAYQFIPAAPGVKDKVTNFFVLGIWVFVVALVLRYLAIHLKLL